VYSWGSQPYGEFGTSVLNITTTNFQRVDEGEIVGGTEKIFLMKNGGIIRSKNSLSLYYTVQNIRAFSSISVVNAHSTFVATTLNNTLFVCDIALQVIKCTDYFIKAVLVKGPAYLTPENTINYILWNRNHTQMFNGVYLKSNIVNFALPATHQFHRTEITTIPDMHVALLLANGTMLMYGMNNSK
jgi:hypothetical protein